MKSEKGVTLINIVVYLIGMTLIISALAGISNFFFQNKNYLLEKSKYISEYNKFNMYFIEDLKKNKTAEIEPVYKKNSLNVETDVLAGSRIIFADGTVYTYRKYADGDGENDYGIYRNRVKICSGIENCIFQIVPASNSQEITTGPYKGKRIITVQMTIDSFTTLNNYVLKYW